MKKGDSVVFLSKAGKPTSWKGTVLAVFSDLNKVAVQWQGGKGNRETFEVNDLVRVQAAAVEA